MSPVTLIDERDGDGVTSSNPGVLYEWLRAKRPRQAGPRSLELAVLADSPHRPIDTDTRVLAASYQFAVYPALTEWR